MQREEWCMSGWEIDTQPSQAAREAAAAYYETHHPDKLAAHYMRNPVAAKIAGEEHPLVQAFARFERDTEKRIRESLAGEANVERVALGIYRADYERGGQAARDNWPAPEAIGSKPSALWNDYLRHARAAIAALERTTDAG